MKKKCHPFGAAKGVCVHGNLVYDQLLAGGGLCGLLLLSGGVRLGAAAEKAPVFCRPAAVPVRGAYRGQKRKRCHRPAAGKHSGTGLPQDLLDVYVVADNCTDNTAAIAREQGARVFERFNKLQVGKGYALAFLLEKIREDYPQERYDGYFVFDADNLLDPHYVTEMNKVFTNGNRVVTATATPKTMATTGSPPATACGFCGRAST